MGWGTTRCMDNSKWWRRWSGESGKQKILLTSVCTMEDNKRRRWRRGEEGPIPSFNVNHWLGHGWYSMVWWGCGRCNASSLTQTHFKWFWGDTSVTDASWQENVLLFMPKMQPKALFSIISQPLQLGCRFYLHSKIQMNKGNDRN